MQKYWSLIKRLSKIAKHNFKKAEEIRAFKKQSLRYVDATLEERKILRKWNISPSSSRLYNFQTYPPDLFLNDWERKRTHAINGVYGRAISNKFLSHQILGSTLRIPQLIALVFDGSIEYENDDEFAEDSRELFLKPILGAAGKGAEDVSVNQGLISFEGKEFKLKQYIRKRIQSGCRSFIIQEKIKQSDFMSTLYQASTNTVRVITIRDPTTREVFAARAVLRVGTIASSPVDSFSQGGISFHLDMKDGKIGAGGTNVGVTRLHSHPETGTVISGKKLIGFESVLSNAVAGHMSMPYINYAGWDFGIDSQGAILVEVNRTTDVDLLQMHEPLLSDVRLRDFYKYHGIIDR